AIHMIGTLKSVNDRSLSDWQGVIGDEISAQREAQEEREEHLSQLLERLESLPAVEAAAHLDEQDSTSDLSNEVQSIRKELRVLAAQVSGVPVRALKTQVPRQKIENVCPNCNTVVRYRQRAKENGIKSFKCANCGTKLYSTYTNGSFSVKARKPKSEVVWCPFCKLQGIAEVDPVPGTQTPTTCKSCGKGFVVVRSSTGVAGRVFAPGENRPITEGLLSEIASKMPAQPWPTGAAKAVAAELGISNGTMSEAITELIKR